MPPSSQQAYNSLQDYSKNRRSTQDIQKEADTKYDVNGISSRLSGLRSLVGNLQSSVEQVDPSVRGRLSGGFATEGQASALVNREQAPILANLDKEQTALGNENQNFNTATSLAGQLASSLRSDDETGYQRLLDQYNAATAQEQAAEAKRQWEAQQAEQKRQFDVQAAASAKVATRSDGYDLSSILNSLNSPKQSDQSSTDKTQQIAYNDVKNVLNSKDPARIQREYQAIKKSAGYGNAYDKVKLDLFEQLYPAAKNFGKNTVALSTAQPTIAGTLTGSMRF